MKITVNQLRKIIAEEVSLISEAATVVKPTVYKPKTKVEYKFYAVMDKDFVYDGKVIHKKGRVFDFYPGRSSVTWSVRDKAIPDVGGEVPEEYYHFEKEEIVTTITKESTVTRTEEPGPEYYDKTMRANYELSRKEFGREE